MFKQLTGKACSRWILVIMLSAGAFVGCGDKSLFYKEFETEKVLDFGNYGGGYKLYSANPMDFSGESVMTYSYVSDDDKASAEALTSYMKDVVNKGYIWTGTGKWAETAAYIAQKSFDNLDELDYEPVMAFVSDNGAFILTIEIGTSDTKLHFIVFGSRAKAAWEKPSNTDDLSSDSEVGDDGGGVVDLTR